MPIQTTDLDGRKLLDLQQDLASLTVGELLAFLNALAGKGIPLVPVLALSQVALTGGPLISKTYAREEWLDLLRAGRCFAARSSQAAGGVGTGTALQLRLPGTATKKALVFCVLGYSSTAYPAGTFMSLYMDNTARANVIGSPAPINLRNGGIAPQAELRGEALAGTTAPLTASIADRPALTAFGFVDFSPQLSGMPQAFFAELDPAEGISIFAGLANTSLFAYWYWAEVPSDY